MALYYIIQDEKQVGPISKYEFDHYKISSSTLVWAEGMKDWVYAREVPELLEFIDHSLPPSVPDTSLPPAYDPYKKHDYSRVEDIAGVDYKKAMIITAIFLAINILIPSVTLTTLGMILATVLSILSWYYFKAYFDSRQDKITGKWILVIMGSQALFCLLYIFVRMNDWLVTGVSVGVEVLINILSDGPDTTTYAEKAQSKILAIIIAFLVASIANFISGIKILLVNKRYPFPLKRIALSTMILIPFLFMTWFSEGVLEEGEPTIFSRSLLSLPYFFLLHHFYRAETEDATS